MRDLIIKKDIKALLEYVKKMHPYDIIEELNKLTPEEQTLFYSLLPEDEVSRIVAYMEPEEAADVIDEFDINKQKNIIENLDLDDAADIIVHLDNEEELIEGLDKDDSIVQVLKYDDEKVGAHMSDTFISLLLGTDIKVATRNVIQKAGEIDAINHIFIVDEHNKYKGSVQLRNLVRTKAPAVIDDITEASPFAYAEDDIEESVHKMRSYGLHEIAVVNNEDELIGILTIDDAIEIYQEEAVEDFEKLSALPDTRTKGVMRSSFKRLPWLLLLLVLSMPIALATSRFEEVITSVTVLAIFQPLILDAGGDVASQTLAVTLRLLANNPKKALKNGGTEILTGLINGLILGAVAGIVSIVLSISIGIAEPFLVALVVFISLTIAVILGPIFGLFVPILFDKLNIDPAVASSPLITTLIDVTSVIIYFGVATLLLGVV